MFCGEKAETIYYRGGEHIKLAQKNTRLDTTGCERWYTGNILKKVNFAYLIKWYEQKRTPTLERKTPQNLGNFKIHKDCLIQTSRQDNVLINKKKYLVDKWILRLRLEHNVKNVKRCTNTCNLPKLVGWLVILFYGVSTLFGSFNE